MLSTVYCEFHQKGFLLSRCADALNATPIAEPRVGEVGATPLVSHGKKHILKRIFLPLVLVFF